jgi:hypothetical protein
MLFQAFLMWILQGLLLLAGVLKWIFWTAPLGLIKKIFK